MRNFTFTEKLGRDEFNSLALQNGSRVKAHFLSSYEWGEVSARRNRTPFYTGVYENGRLVATCVTTCANGAKRAEGAMDKGPIQER